MFAELVRLREMRGKPQAQPEFLTILNLNQRVPADHPLRGIKERVDKVLVKLSPLFDALYADEGRPSSAYNASNKGESFTRTLSTRSLIPRRGWSAGTRWFRLRIVKNSGWA